MDRQELAKLWDEAWETGLWAGAWKRAVDGLTPAQAEWRPADGRHSIAQIVEHMTFWREVSLKRAAGGGGPNETEVAAGNFPNLPERSDAAWRKRIDGLRASQQAVAAALAQADSDISRAPYMLAHDSYHMGQIMYLRAMQGLPVIE